MAFVFKVNSKPEKVIVAATASVVLSIIFDEKKKKRGKHPEKYKNFPKRVMKYYKLADTVLKKTAAKQLYDETEHFKDEKLEALTIENGEFIDI